MANTPQVPGKKIEAVLIFRARDQSLRIFKRRPRLDWDEIFFNLTVTIPPPWGRLAGAVTIDLPANGPAVIEVKNP